MIPHFPESIPSGLNQNLQTPSHTPPPSPTRHTTKTRFRQPHQCSWFIRPRQGPPLVSSLAWISPCVLFVNPARLGTRLRSACSLPHGSRTPARGGYPAAQGLPRRSAQREGGKSKRQKSRQAKTRRQTKKPLRRKAGRARNAM